MKKVISTLILTPALLIGCGVSDEEKANIAAVTCSVMGETRNMDAAIRVREINAARERIGEAPYLDGDEGIKQSFEFGLCDQLVLNDPLYDETLKELQRIAAEAERIARKKREEERLKEATSLLIEESTKYVRSFDDIWISAEYFESEDGMSLPNGLDAKRGVVLSIACDIPAGVFLRFDAELLGKRSTLTHTDDHLGCVSFLALDDINDSESELIKSMSSSGKESPNKDAMVYNFVHSDLINYTPCGEACFTNIRSDLNEFVK
jgi:hypothetical protein